MFLAMPGGALVHVLLTFTCAGHVLAAESCLSAVIERTLGIWTCTCYRCIALYVVSTASRTHTREYICYWLGLCRMVSSDGMRILQTSEEKRKDEKRHKKS
jgi:hypothetical protein